MEEVICPHCDGEIKLPGNARGEFTCPLCEEDFVFEGKNSATPTAFDSTVSGPRSEGTSVVGVLLGLLILAIPLVSIYFLMGGAFHAYNVNTWPIEEVEILETSYDRIYQEHGTYYEVAITFSHENRERTATVDCGTEWDAESFMEEHPVGTFIDVRLNPEQTGPMYEIDGGCDPWTKEDIIFSVGCMGILIVLAFVESKRIVGRK